MTWRLNDIEAAALERRAVAQLRADARELLAADPGMTDRELLLRLNWRGYSCEELVRLNEAVKTRC